MGLIRLLLALAVVAHHCGSIWKFNMVGGQIAVQSFFIISGFYMSLILNEKYIGKNKSYKLFISNRFLRLYPVYWAVLLCMLLATIGIAIASKGHYMGKFDGYLGVAPNICSFGYMILTNIFIFGQDVVMFLGIHANNGNLFFTGNFWKTSPALWTFLFIPQAWTLGVELTFYLIAPFLLRKRVTLIVSLIFFSLALRLFIFNYLGLKGDPWTYRFFPTEIMFFLFGYMSFTILLRIQKIAIPKLISISIWSFITIFTLLYSFIPDAKFNSFPFSEKEILYFVTVVLSIPVLFNFSKRNKLDNKIGELSYPVYICHNLVALVIYTVPGTFLDHSWIITLAVLAFSYLLVKLIAEPVERYRQARLVVQTNKI
jgi:peptidoglycan/LPS O-acetylase OafA/YrhL